MTNKHPLRDLEADIRDHIDRETEDNIERGMTPEEARYAALRKFGNVTLSKEDARTVWIPVWMDQLRQDARYAGWTLRRSPGFAAVAIITIALAIGPTAAIFSLLNALVLRDLPVREPSTLVQIATTSRTQDESHLTFPMLRELSARQNVFGSLIGAWGNTVVTVDDHGALVKGLMWAATGNIYSELGLRPVVGRLFLPGDMSLDPPAAQPVVVLGHTFWQRHYQGDGSVVGRTVHVQGAPFTIIGVAPAGFTGFGLLTEPDLTIPLAATPVISGRDTSTLATSVARTVRVVGRLKPNVTIEQARAHLTAVWPSVREAALPPSQTGAGRDDFLSIPLTVRSAAKGTETALRTRYAEPLLIVLGIAGLVLLIACVNFASLLLTRASVRRKEFGVRLALGASRWRVSQQLATEGVLLSLIGAACGIGLAFWVSAEITAVAFEDYTVPVVFDGRPDLKVLALTTAVATIAGIVCSVLPAWRATRGRASDALQTAGRAFSGSGRAGRVLVGCQVALSLVLLTTAGVLVRSLSELRALNTGIERSDEVLVAYPEAARPGAYQGVDNDAYYPQALARIEALPGVRKASVSLLKPGAGGGFREEVVQLGSSSDARRGVDATRSPVAPGFFATVGLPLIKGRDFDWRDKSRGRRVTILSATLAQRLFGDADPLGQHVRVGVDPSRNDLEVVGVAADARLYDPKNPDLFALYTAAVQDPNASFKCFVIRGERVSLPALTQAVEALGRERIDSMVTLQHITEQSLLLERLTAMLSSFFGVLVLILAGVGLFGLMSYAVTERRREIGVCMALGASPRRVVSNVVRDTLVVTLAGLGMGLIVAFVTVQSVKALLFGVTPHDPLTLVMAIASLIAVAMLACVIPAFRAARVDPMIALRNE